MEKKYLASHSDLICSTHWQHSDFNRCGTKRAFHPQGSVHLVRTILDRFTCRTATIHRYERYMDPLPLSLLNRPGEGDPGLHSIKTRLPCMFLDLLLRQAAPRLCNSLPLYIRSSQTLEMSKSSLKYHFFHPVFCFLYVVILFSCDCLLFLLSFNLRTAH